MAVVDLLRILERYLNSNVLEHDGVVMTQKEGICIGSAVAPFLAKLYLNTLDQKGAAFIN